MEKRGSGKTSEASKSPLMTKRKRTRNGCLTCRDRHLKCDEQQPICNNCIKSKKECLRGVRLNFLQLNKHKVARNYFNYKPLGNNVKFLDQSIVTASFYQKGIHSYKPYMYLHSKNDLKKAEVDFKKNLDVTLPPLESSHKRQKSTSRSSGNLREENSEFAKLIELSNNFNNSLAMEIDDNTGGESINFFDLFQDSFDYAQPPKGLLYFLETKEFQQDSKDGLRKKLYGEKSHKRRKKAQPEFVELKSKELGQFQDRDQKDHTSESSFGEDYYLVDSDDGESNLSESSEFTSQLLKQQKKYEGYIIHEIDDKTELLVNVNLNQPILGKLEIELYKNFSNICCFFLDMVINRVTFRKIDYTNFWSKSLVPEYILKDESLAKFLYRSSAEFIDLTRENENLITFEKKNELVEFTDNFRQKLIENFPNLPKDYKSYLSLTKVDLLNYERLIVASTLLLVGVFVKTVIQLNHSKNGKDKVDFQKLIDELTTLKQILLDPLVMNLSSSDKNSGNPSIIVEKCINSVFSIDLFTSILLNRKTIIDPFRFKNFSKIDTKEFLKIRHNDQLEFRSKYKYDDSNKAANEEDDEEDEEEEDEEDDDDDEEEDDDNDNDDEEEEEEEVEDEEDEVDEEEEGEEEEEEEENDDDEEENKESLSVPIVSEYPSLLDDTYNLATIFKILHKLNYAVKDGHPAQSDWNLILQELNIFENNLPIVFSPISIGPLKTKASQALVMVGVADVGENSPSNVYSSRPPFPKIKFTSDIGLILHIIHHSIYLLSEKYKPENRDSFFQRSNHNSKHDNQIGGIRKSYMNFRLIKWYNESIPQDKSSNVSEEIHMARRLISIFLALDEDRNTKNVDMIWLYYYWCFNLAKEFLSKDDLIELNRRMAKRPREDHGRKQNQLTTVHCT
ncbi:hypothetical protein PACTADRAFT_36086 [Pachysolen tannophilus NRRL Y-2460]|uniref:Zn(2)-C6 fungal-type domain-containing protein n=1 Tax=Pachysolen tannophilus NRRL Y-2460 TaxID=669874 RepID=A0A1E4TP01_PACTA|nr:hypothetical protein PACTADRAFT_36086 [Pachysolen tannophilus NRRL Y-2460]